MTIVYVACDGTQFDNKEECLNYENRNSLLNNNSFCLFNKEGKILSFPSNCTTYDKLEEAYFFICKTEECANALMSYIKEQYSPYFFPEKIESNIFYGYGINGKEYWISLSEVIKEYKAQIDELKNLSDKLFSQL